MPESVDLSQHELSWLLFDALDLIQRGRKYSAMLLLLCGVDALALEANPGERVGARFEAFLKSKMRRAGRAQIWNMFVPKEDQLMTFESILYRYLRNPLVHEGATLQLEDSDRYAIQIDWVSIPRGVKVDSNNKRLVLGGDLILDVLVDAVSEGIKESLASRAPS